MLLPSKKNMWVYYSKQKGHNKGKKICTKNNTLSRKFIAIKSKGKVHNVKTSTDFKDHPKIYRLKEKNQSKAHLI